MGRMKLTSPNITFHDAWKKYKRTNVAEMRKVTTKEINNPEQYMSGISISEEDKNNGSPKEGDMIARNPQNHNDKWLVAKKYFEENFEEL